MAPGQALIVDAGVIYSAADRRDPDHERARDTLTEWQGELVLSAFTAAEADYLILDRLGVDAELGFLKDLGSAYTLELLDQNGLAEAAAICERYRDLELGLADASIVVLASKWSTVSLASFDRRHFHAVRPTQGGSFELSPT